MRFSSSVFFLINRMYLGQDQHSKILLKIFSSLRWYSREYFRLLGSNTRKSTDFWLSLPGNRYEKTLFCKYLCENENILGGYSRYYWFMKKTRHQKYHASVPLNKEPHPVVLIKPNNITYFSLTPIKSCVPAYLWQELVRKTNSHTITLMTLSIKIQSS